MISMDGAQQFLKFISTSLPALLGVAIGSTLALYYLDLGLLKAGIIALIGYSCVCATCWLIERGIGAHVRYTEKNARILRAKKGLVDNKIVYHDRYDHFVDPNYPQISWEQFYNALEQTVYAGKPICSSCLSSIIVKCKSHRSMATMLCPQCNNSTEVENVTTARLHAQAIMRGQHRRQLRELF